MFSFLKSLLNSVARGLGWAARISLGLACDVVEAPFVALWRQLFPAPVEAEESTADVLKQVASLIVDRTGVADAKAQREMPVAKPMSQARMRRVQEDALRYLTARLHGERLPSLSHVPAAMAHELYTLKPRDVDVMHRQLIGDLGITGSGWWDGPESAVHAPGHDETPTLRYA